MSVIFPVLLICLYAANLSALRARASRMLLLLGDRESFSAIQKSRNNQTSNEQRCDLIHCDSIIVAPRVTMRTIYSIIMVLFPKDINSGR